MLERSLEESKTRENQLRANTKVSRVIYISSLRGNEFSQTLREELRKVQSSAALLDRQRNRGVGFWSSRSDSTPPEPSGTPSPPSGRPSTSDSPSSGDKEEEVNLEYLRNVILQFLEH